jgi:hypothetical protein
MEMASLIPNEAVEALRQEMGGDFDQLDNTERLAAVTALTEGCVTHRRLMELTKDHPHDLTLKLHSLVDRGVLESDGQGRSAFYFLPGRHPINDGELGISVPSEMNANNSMHSGTNSLRNEANSLHNSMNSLHKENTMQGGVDRNDFQEKKIREIASLVSSRQRTNPNEMRTVIQKLCSIKELSIRELADILRRNEETLRTRYVSPMCGENLLERVHPNIINHPDQRYRATKKVGS